MNSNDQSPTQGFAILIKAAGATRRFVPREGETITITDFMIPPLIASPMAFDGD